MGSVLTGCPVAANVMSKLFGGRFFLVEAGDVEAILPGFIDDFSISNFLAFTPHGNELPTADQAGFLWINRNSLKAPTVEAPVIALPVGDVLRGKKNLGAT